MPVGIIAALASTVATGAGVYTSIQQAKEQEKFAKRQEKLQKQKQAKQLSERKKRIDLMHREMLAPSLFGGRRSLMTGTERGLMQTTPREVLG